MNDKDTIPTFADISPTLGENFDEQWAVKHFLGNDHAAMAEIFCKEPEAILAYLEDLMFMGGNAFMYYFKSFTAYTKTNAALGDDMTVESILRTVELRAEYEPSIIIAMKDEILEFTDYVSNNISRFMFADFDAHDASDILELCDNVRQYIASLCGLRR